jgi:hypothetical protein
MSRASLLSNLRHEMSIAKTLEDPGRLSDAIYAAQLAVSPSDKTQTPDAVKENTEFIRRNRYTDRDDMEFVLRFFEQGSTTPEHCEQLATLLIHKHSFKLTKPVDPQALAQLEIAESESFKAAEALLDAKNEANRAFTQLQSILVQIKLSSE